MDAVDNLKQWRADMASYQNQTSLSVFEVSAKSGQNILVSSTGSVRQAHFDTLPEREKTGGRAKEERQSRGGLLQLLWPREQGRVIS